MKNIIGYLSLVSGRLGLLFVAGGLFIIAADYVHNWPREDDSDAAANVVQCMRAGTCEAS